MEKFSAMKKTSGRTSLFEVVYDRIPAQLFEHFERQHLSPEYDVSTRGIICVEGIRDFVSQLLESPLY